MTSAEARVRIATYNVLSPTLCSTKWFPKCTSEATDAEKRLKRVCDILSKETDKASVICLQEVGQGWVGPLTVMLEKANYGLVLNSYSETMAVGVAWPRDHFTLEACNIDRVSRTRSWPADMGVKISFAERMSAFFHDMWNKFMGVLYSVGIASLFTSTSKKASDFNARRYRKTWAEDAKGRWNNMVTTRLKAKETGAEFCVSTYHMPCAFWEPRVMVVHSALAANRATKLAKGLPHILAGDFNFAPDTPMYHMLTTGALPADFSPAPKVNDDDKWEAKVNEPFTSAYAQAAGAEPDFTNWAHPLPMPEEFIDTIDFIFMSKECKAVDVEKLPNRGDVQGPFPTVEQPSDHMLIAADINIPVKSTASSDETED